MMPMPGIPQKTGGPGPVATKGGQVVTVEGELALRSKLPNDDQDYRVLARSASLTPDAWERMYRQLNVGSLGGTGATPLEQPPWITLGAFTDGDRRYLAVIQYFRIETVDRTGRTNAALPALLLPYDEVAGAAPALNTLDALLQAQWPIEPAADPLPRPRIELPDPADRQSQLAHLLDETIGFEFAAGVAGLLITGPVALLAPRGEAFTPVQRLDYLDALVALLPFGSRCDLACSTWMVNSSPHKMRLGFSTSARSDQQRIEWGKPPTEALAANEMAAHYARLLVELRTYLGDTATLLARLAADTTVLAFEKPESFLDCLREIDLPFVVLKDVEAGKARLEDLRRVFDADPAALGEGLGKVVAYWVARLSEAQDIPRLTPYLRTMLPDELGALALKRFDAAHATPGPESGALLDLLVQLAGEGNMLVALLTPLLPHAEQLAGTTTTTLEQGSVSRRPAEILLRYLRTLPAADATLLRCTFASKPGPFLAELARAGLDVPDPSWWLNWLGADDPAIQAWLQPFGVAAGLAADRVSVQALVAVHSVLDTLLATAVQRGTLPYFAGGLLDWVLPWLAKLDPAVRTYVQKLHGMTSLTPNEQARLDIVTLALDPDQPLWLDSWLADSSTTFDAYRVGLAAALQAADSRITDQMGAEHLALIITRLVEHLLALPTTAHWASPTVRANTLTLVNTHMDTFRRVFGLDRLDHLKLNTMLVPDASRDDVLNLLGAVLADQPLETILPAAARLLAERQLVPDAAALNGVIDDLLGRLASVDRNRQVAIARDLRQQALRGTMGPALREAYFQYFEDSIRHHLMSADQELSSIWKSADPQWQAVFAEWLRDLAQKYNR